MSNINDEMKAHAEDAIKAAKLRFGLELDYSEQSIGKLENLLGLVYWGFYNNARDEGERGVIYNAAVIWGSYLGEYMRLKWGGTWILKDSDKIVSIKNMGFSPIRFVFEKITSHPEYSLKNYLEKLESKIISAPIIPQQSQDLSENIGQLEKQVPIKQPKKTIIIDKHLSFTLAGIGIRLLLVVACIVGYIFIQKGSDTFFGLMALPTGSSSKIPVENILGTATSYSINIQDQTFTPSFTPYLTNTQLATLMPAETQKPIDPTQTQAPFPSPTPIPVYHTNTPIPPTKRPRPTATKVPPPTATELPQPTATELPPPTATELPLPTATESIPIIVDSCNIDPSTVPVDKSVTITFIVHFSPPTPGMGFKTVFDSTYPGQKGCEGIDSDGDGMAYCDGSSGTIPGSTTVYVTFKTAVGNCVASYSSR